MEFDKSYNDYLVNRGGFRRFIRSFYLKDVRKYITGKCIDFGCGAGEFLKVCDSGSYGLEVNKKTVEYCKAQDLNVDLYNPESDKYELKDIQKGVYQMFVSNHVMEHLDNPDEVIKKLFESCHDKGISRIVLTVPGYKSFFIDSTHKTFVDLDYLKTHNVLDNKYYKLSLAKHYPFNSKFISEHLVHVELRLVFDRLENNE